MLRLTQKKKSQFRALDAYSVIESLSSNIKTLVDLLPLEDKETFAYLISHPSEDATVERVSQRRFWNNAQMKSQQSHFITHSGKDSRKAALDKKGNHQPSFGCDCFQCYVFHWSRWDASPNQGLIHEAILLNESAGLSKAQGTVHNRTEWKPQRGLVKCYEARSCSSSLILSNKTEGNGVYLETSSTLKLDELVTLATGQKVEDQDLMKCRCDKISAMEVVITGTIFQRKGNSKSIPGRYPVKEEIKPKKKRIVRRIDSSLKGSTEMQQETNHHASPVKISMGNLPAKCSSKQVAPICYKRGCAAETSSLEPEAKSQEEASKKGKQPRKLQTSLTHVFSEALSFLADRLFAMWYSRRCRGIRVF